MIVAGREAPGATLVREVPHVASPSQRAAIEAAGAATLVLAGPGAGKTFCLIERIRFLIEHLGFDPARICAFTFTNRAAEEISARLSRQLGVRAERVKRGTIHAFCAELLREFGPEIGLARGFGIADEEYQMAVLRRLEGPRRWHRAALTKFCAHRFRGEPLHPNDIPLFERYERFLASQNVLDFDSLVLRTSELLERPEAAATIRARWDVILVDEFQDLNPAQYRVIHELSRDHRHVFAVGDDEQSVYSWAGADPRVFRTFVNDFGLASTINLEENRRCPQDVFAAARRLIAINTPIFENRKSPVASREPRQPIAIIAFDTDDAEAAWIVSDIVTHRPSCTDLSDFALLYRTHEVGYRLESALLGAGVPCRLAQGRALSEDPAVGYVLAALRVIAFPGDAVHRDAFFAAVLPKALFDEARAQAEAASQELVRQLERMAHRLRKTNESGRQIYRALYTFRNLKAIGTRHKTLGALIEDLLSQRVGKQRSVLEEHHTELTDPAENAEVIMLARRLRDARDRELDIWIAPLGGVEVAVRGMLMALTFSRVYTGGSPPAGAMVIDADDVGSLGVALGLFKAAQLLETGEYVSAFRDFTVVDIETTDVDTATSEIVEIAAVRVRDGKLVERFNALVKPRVPIAPAATDVHGIRDADVQAASPFEDVWPKFRAFCGQDIIVAHNGYEFDFRILKRMVTARGWLFDLTPYDTLPLARDLCPASRRLGDLAHAFGIDTGRSHRALDDANTLAQVFVRLDSMRLARSRKTALINLLGHLGVALALSDPATLDSEARLFMKLAKIFALGRYSGALEFYEAAAATDPSIPSVDEVIARLGGPKLMAALRADKSADDRYPGAMLRVRRLLQQIGDRPVDEQICEFLARAVLSKWDGVEAEKGRVNLLTLHSTKGLEFSRVYVVGVEDGQMPGGTPTKAATKEEIEEARRLLYVGMTRTKDRLVLTTASTRGGKPSGGRRFLDEMALVPQLPS